MREAFCLLYVLHNRELLVERARNAQEIHRRRRIAEVERIHEEAAVEQQAHRAAHTYIVERRTRPVHREIAHHDRAARRNGKPLILRQLVRKHGRHRTEIEHPHDLLRLECGKAHIGAGDAAHHDAVRTRLLPVVVLVALQEDIAILHIFDNAERACPNRHPRKISIIRQTRGRIDGAAEVHHVVELVDVRLRKGQSERKRIQRLRTDEPRIVVLAAAGVERRRARLLLHPCEVVRDHLRGQWRAVVKPHPLAQMKHPHAPLVQHLPRCGKAGSGRTRLLIRRDERLPDTENLAAVVAVVHARRELAVCREHDGIVRRVPRRRSAALLCALSAACSREQNHEQHEYAQTAHNAPPFLLRTTRRAEIFLPFLFMLCP